MIKFDINKLRVETYWVKSLTTALGGAIRIVDEEHTTDEKEVYNRLPVPLAVVRAYKTKHKTMKYIRPCLIAVTYYDDRAIALERHPQGCMGERIEKKLDGTWKEWYPQMKENINGMLRPLVCATPIWNEDTKKYDPRPRHDWYFDGRYIFTFEQPVETAVAKGEFLSTDGRFRCVQAQAIGLHKLSDREKLDPADRTCLAYVAENNKFAVSPPIWKDAKAVGQAKIKGTHTERDGGRTTERDLNFDRVDQFCAVNLSFALKAARDLSHEFGFEAIEPLNLPALMIRLNTVNLPKISPAVKDTFDSGLKFTHALAWLLGFARRCECLDTYASIRSLLKYLTANGLYFKQAFDPKNIFKEGHNLETIPLISKKEALEKIDSLTLEERLEIVRAQRNRLQTTRGGNVVGNMMFDDDPE